MKGMLSGTGDEQGLAIRSGLLGRLWRPAVKVCNPDGLIDLAETHVARFDGQKLTAVPRGQASPSQPLRLAVVIPTRLQCCRTEDGGRPFVARAIESIQAQTLDQAVEATFVLGVDADAIVPEAIAGAPNVVVARSSGRSQILALNAAIALIGEAYDFVAFLEDDDRWSPHFLAWSLLALTAHDFVSMSHLEVDEADRPVNLQDFPTPSSWLMPVATLQRVGAVDPRSKWHYDNEWLGRLGVSGLRRCHLFEKGAPLSLPRRLRRPGIGHLMRRTGPMMTLLKHGSDEPLVRRLVHPGSGTSALAANSKAALEGKQEYRWLIERYGYIPW